jgi:hypothetical protein
MARTSSLANMSNAPDGMCQTYEIVVQQHDIRGKLAAKFKLVDHQVGVGELTAEFTHPSGTLCTGAVGWKTSVKDHHRVSDVQFLKVGMSVDDNDAVPAEDAHMWAVWLTSLVCNNWQVESGESGALQANHVIMLRAHPSELDSTKFLGKMRRAGMQCVEHNKRFCIAANSAAFEAGTAKLLDDMSANSANSGKITKAGIIKVSDLCWHAAEQA